MPLGKVVRRALGPLEPAAIRTYRDAFIDIDSLAITIGSLVPEAVRILEIGCGDGAMAASLCRVLPAAELLGIDPGMTNPGRMFDGDRSRVQFAPVPTGQLIADGAEPFDLVVLCDVLHHVADDERVRVLRDAAALTAPGGTVAVKEWENRGGVGGAVAYCADR